MHLTPVRLRFQIALFALTRIFIDTNVRMIYPFLAVFARGLGVDLTAISLVLAVRSLLGVFNPLLSAVSDLRGRRTGMVAGMLLFAFGLTVPVLFQTYTAFFVSQCLSFVGLYLYVSTTQAYLGDVVVYHRRGLAIALMELGWSFSFIIGMPLVAFAISRWGWSAAFPLLAGLGWVSVGLLLWIIPPGPAPSGVQASFWGPFRAVFTSRAAVAGLVMGLCLTCANEVVNVVFGVWMEDSFGLQVIALGAASTAIGISELGGEGLSALVVDRLGKERSVLAGLLVMGGVSLLLPFIGRSLVGALAGLFLFYLGFEFSLVSSLPLMTEVLPGARATLMGINVAAFSLGRAFGSLAAPWLYGLGFAANSLTAAALILVAILALRRIRVRHTLLPI